MSCSPLSGSISVVNATDNKFDNGPGIATVLVLFFTDDDLGSGLLVPNLAFGLDGPLAGERCKVAVLAESQSAADRAPAC